MTQPGKESPAVNDPGLVKVEFDGRRYVAFREEFAGEVSACIRERLSRVAKAAGVDLPVDVPLWALALQLDVAGRGPGRLAGGPDSGGIEQVPPLSVHDVGERTGYKPDAIRKAARRGALRGVLVGRDWRFWPDDVDEWRPRRESA